jgi:hypothetical protein
MSDDELEPLIPALRALLDEGGKAPPSPPGVKERLLRRVEASVMLPPTGGGGGHGGTDGDLPNHGPSLASSALAQKIPLLATVFAIGVATGAGGHALVSNRDTAATAPAVPVAAVQDPGAPPIVPPPPATPSTSVEVPLVQAPAVHAEPKEVASPGRDTQLAAERALIETARAALARGDAARALSALDRHAREFANGRLVEEREALAIQALSKTGDMAAAKTRAERFRQRFARSLFLPVVDEAIREPQ